MRRKYEAVSHNAVKAALKPYVSALGETPKSQIGLICRLSRRGNTALGVIINTSDSSNMASAGLSAPCHGSQRVCGQDEPTGVCWIRTASGGSRRSCAAGRGGIWDHCASVCALFFSTRPSDLNCIFIGASLSRWTDRSLPCSPGMHLVVESLSLFMSSAPESLDSSCPKASKVGGPRSVFETGWHRFPRL